LDAHGIDVVVLARYMQILSPDFVFRHEGRIINIHPSLLPAFPGPRSYHQAFNKGVDFVGVTAHFVTTDLDEGPIICQDAFRVNKEKDTVENYIQKGRALEAKVLAKAVELFCADKLSLRRGKVMVGKKEHDTYQKSKEFYQFSAR
jgi:formyltetrahydrofolate deformylase